MNRKIIVILFWFLTVCAVPVYSQLLTTTVQPVTSCPGNYTVVITVANFTGVGAISLNLNYSAPNVTYQGYQNLNSALAGGMTIINAANGQVVISWASVTPVSIGSGTLVELLFSSGYGTFPFQWDTGTPGHCEYSDIYGNIIPATFANGSATVHQPPLITQQPANKIAYVGNNISFYFGVTGAGLTYQWQISTNGGGSWINLTNTPPYSGVNSTTLNINPLVIGFNGNQYRCQVSGTCPPPVTSTAAVLFVFQVIQVAAPNLSPCSGSVTVPLTVQNCNGVGAISLKLGYNTNFLTYTGYQSLNVALSGGTFYINASSGEVIFSWARTTAANVGSGTLVELIFTSAVGNAYLNWNNLVDGNCEFSDIYGNVINSTYTNGTVNTQPPPAITGQPANKEILAGQNTNFQVTATGAGLTYQWQLSINSGSNWSNLTNTPPYSGVNSNPIYITGATLGMNGYKFRCVVSGTCPPPVTSNLATLTVLPVVTTTVGTISNSCTGNLIVPINVSNCNNVGAISLALNFNPAQITYDGYLDPHSELSEGFLIVNGISGKVIMSWASTNPADIPSGTLIKFKFILPSGSGSLTWDTQTQGACEYSDPIGNVIAGIYNNGTVSVTANPLIANAGTDVLINQGSSATLNGSATGGSGGYSYSWSPASYLSNPNIANPLATPPSTITYNLTVTSGSCQASNNVTITVQPVQGIQLNLTVMLEGPYVGPNMSALLISQPAFPLAQPYGGSPWNYSGTEQVASIPNNNVVDWILVDLRDAATAEQATPASRIARKAAFLLNNGSIVDIDGISNLLINVTVSQNLFVVLCHRNHLGVMSAVPLTQAKGNYSYDFTSGSDQAFGVNAQKQLTGGKWGLFSGDGDANNTINNTDKTGVWTPNAGKKGYLNADFNLNGQASNQDKNDYWLPNIGSSCQVP